MPNAFRHAPAGDHVGHGVLACNRYVAHIVHDLAHAGAQLLDRFGLHAFFATNVPVHHTLLRVAQAVALGDGDHIVQLVHVQVAAGAIVVLQQGHHGLVPAIQHFAFARIGGIEVDAALGATDRRTTHAELYLHGLGKALHFATIEALAHARTTTRCTAAQAVDHHPAPRTGGRIGPLEDDLGGALLKALQGITHHFLFGSGRM